jgi:HSP20 family molecular chaperone IbpA
MEFLVRPRLGAFQPNADVFVDEDQRCVVVVIEVAGADAESLRIGVDERSLIITGRRRKARLRGGSFVQKEIAHGEFVKRITLPVAVAYEQIGATYEDGLLTVVAPIAVTAYLPTTRTELHILVKRTHS